MDLILKLYRTLLQEFYDHLVLLVVPNGYIQRLSFNRLYIMDYWIRLDQHIIQFIQRVIVDANICPTEEHWFFCTQHSSSCSSSPTSPLESSIVIKHTPPTCIQDHQSGILYEYSRLYHH